MSSDKITINAKNREAGSYNAARRLRHAGMVPAVMYNDKTESTSLAVNEREFAQYIHHNGVITLDIEGKAVSVIIKDVQYNHLAGKVMHVDFMEIDKTHKVKTVVAIESEGSPVGVAKGGQLAQNLHEIELSCLPENLIEVLTVDVSALDVDCNILVRDLELPEGVTALTAPTTAVFLLNASKVEAASEE